MNDFLQSVLNTPAPYGTAVLWRLGQMGLLVKMGDAVLCVDCYAAENPSRLVPPPFPVEEAAGVTAFLGTHDHADHMDHPSWQVWAKQCPNALFVFPEAHHASVLSDGVSEKNCRGLNDGESCQIGEITVRAIAAAHEFLNRDPETGCTPACSISSKGTVCASTTPGIPCGMKAC